jgi:ferric-dicitrate binding protein FerR (iron transport regulator)
MQKDEQYYRELLLRYIQSKSSPQEAQEVLDYLQTGHSAKLLLQSLQEEFQSSLQTEEPVNAAMGDRVRNRLLQTIESTPIITRSFQWLRVAAAAAVIIALGILAYIFYPSTKKEESISQVQQPAPPAHDVAPGTNAAILTLADGTQIPLGTESTNHLPKQGNVSVINAQGQLVYQNTAAKPGEIVYNTLTSARGQSYSLVLSDGTKLWLNASSSVRFPVAFTDRERDVEITGEVYFEVAKDASRPFRVKTNDMQVEVLGTQFDINAYPDETGVTTTLVEGSVKVNTKDKVLHLSPGQQSKLLSNGSLQLLKDVNVDEIIAWKNGFFHFESADLRSILRQFSRWYDIEVVYEGEPKDRSFFAIVNRNSSLANVLKMLNANNIHFTIEGKKLIVHSE